MFSDVFDLNTTNSKWNSAYGIYDLNANGKIDYDDHSMFTNELNKGKANGK